jgi:hypothetical protein
MDNLIIFEGFNETCGYYGTESWLMTFSLEPSILLLRNFVV